MFPANHPVKPLVNKVAEYLHAEKPFEAARLVQAWVAQKSPDVAKSPMETKEQAYSMLMLLLHFCLDNGAPEEAAQMLWGQNLFDSRPNSTQRIWSAFDNHNFVLLQGAASMSKSYSLGARLLLEWIRDSEYTTVKLLGPSEDHLESNLFSHIVDMHRRSTIPLPGNISKLFIGDDPRSRKGAIAGVVVPLGKKSAGRLQGVKRMRRKKPHPIFGIMTRVFVFVDEISNLPPGLWKDIDNLLASSDGTPNLKIFGAFNPDDQGNDVGVRCEPPDGWGNFDADIHFEWESKRGWHILRLDGMQCENVKTGKIIFPGLQTKEGMDKLIANSGGIGSPGYWTMGRGCFPPLGLAMSVIPAGILNDTRGEPIWYDAPEPCGGEDLALEGADTCVFAKGLFGPASGIRMPADLKHPTGYTHWFTNAKGVKMPRHILFVEHLFKLPRGETVATKDETKRMVKTLKIRPELFAIDKTGNGAGVSDLLRNEWSPAIHRVNFNEGASETRIMTEDEGTAKELYDRRCTELWFAARKWIEFGYVFFSTGLDMSELNTELTGRLFRTFGKKSRVESKDEYKTRHNNKSPDNADAFTLLVHAVRMGSGIVPGMMIENSVASGFETDETYPGDVRVDETNNYCTDDLDRPEKASFEVW